MEKEKSTTFQPISPDEVDRIKQQQGDRGKKGKRPKNLHKTNKGVGNNQKKNQEVVHSKVKVVMIIGENNLPIDDHK